MFLYQNKYKFLLKLIYFYKLKNNYPIYFQLLGLICNKKFLTTFWHMSS